MAKRRVKVATALVASFAIWHSTPAYSQWIYYPTPGIPRTTDGQLDGNATTPRQPDGSPDLSGLWEHDNPLRYLSNIAADLENDVPFQPWARELFEQRMARRGADDPNNFCMPTGIVEKHAVPAPFKIIQLPDLTVILYESRTIFRQIFTDGRPFPDDPQPAWYGYSVGRWEDDTLVVESMGFNGQFWLDLHGAVDRHANDALSARYRPDRAHLR